MKISYNWLKNYINIDFKPEALSEILTDLGLEVENIETFQSVKGGLEGVVVGKVLTKEQHPNADKLSLTTVDVGTGEPLRVVCGAPNVTAGQKVLVATLGTKLYFNNEEVVMKTSKIRGEISEGMICAEDELGIGNSHAGIMVLPENVAVGTLAKEYFEVENDVIFEIGLTPNRIDAASHYGVARDLAAWLKHRKFIGMESADYQLRKASINNFKIDNNNAKIEVIVENNEACPRYSGLSITGVEIKESPKWLKNKLLAIGQKPINNIVDITNFVLHETGQPLHAFDADKITGHKVIVKTLADGTNFTTLDEVERKLAETDLMICNEQTGMCIAGVFGGLQSGINNETKNIFLESAYFNPVSVRKTARRHGLSTDSSFRFERGADPENTIYALKRAATLIIEIAGGNISSEIVDVYPQPIKPFEIEISYKNINRLIGKTFDQETVKNILAALEMKITSETENGLRIETPRYRADVQREADVIEDILRIYGYNNIGVPQQLNSTLAFVEKPDRNKLLNTISDLLSNSGFYETWSNSLTKEIYYNNLPSFAPEKSVKILNPLSSDLNTLRQSLLPGLLEAAIFNANRKQTNIAIYEFGNCYTLDPETKGKEVKGLKLAGYQEEMHLSLLIAGNKAEENWKSKIEKTDFYFLKSKVEKIFTRLGFQQNNFNLNDITEIFYQHGIEYQIGKNTIAEIGKIHPKILKAFEIDFDVYYADFKWDRMLKALPKPVRFSDIPKYPEVRRDLALLVDKKVTFKQITELAEKSEKKLLKSINIFDVYESDKIEAGKKSYAISFTLQDEFKTLTDKVVDKIMDKLIATFKSELAAEIR